MVVTKIKSNPINVYSIVNSTGCLLISVACLSVHNLVIFWCLRGEILNTETSKVYKFVHMMIQIKNSSKH